MSELMQITEKGVMKIASFGYPKDQVVTVLGVHKDGYFVEANGVSKLVSFDTIEAIRAYDEQENILKLAGV